MLWNSVGWKWSYDEPSEAEGGKPSYVVESLDYDGPMGSPKLVVSMSFRASNLHMALVKAYEYTKAHKT